MKKCPYCGADLSENAKFCYYCMKQLNQKSEIKVAKSAPLLPILIISGSLILVVLAVLLLSLAGVGDTPNFTEASRVTDESSSLIASDGIIDSPSDNSQKHDSSVSGDVSTEGPESEPSSVRPSTSSPASSASEASPSYSSRPSASSSVSGAGSSSAKPVSNASVSSSSLPQSDIPFVSCQYRAAQNGDILENAHDLTGKITVTGISEIAENGIYRIPEAIGGKQVIAIDANVFSSAAAENARVIIVPTSVININDFAFSNCSKLTDVYYCGNSIHTESYAFYKNYSTLCAQGIVLHCSESCNDRNYRYYKSTASEYGLTYQKWDGVINLE